MNLEGLNASPLFFFGGDILSFNCCVYQIQNEKENNYDYCSNPKRCLGEEKCYCYYGSEEKAKKECCYHYSTERVAKDLNKVTEIVGNWISNIQKNIDRNRFGFH